MSQHGFVYCVRFTLYHKYKWFDDYDYDDAKKKLHYMNQTEILQLVLFQVFLS